MLNNLIFILKISMIAYFSIMDFINHAESSDIKILAWIHVSSKKIRQKMKLRRRTNMRGRFPAILTHRYFWRDSVHFVILVSTVKGTILCLTVSLRPPIKNKIYLIELKPSNLPGK